MPKETDLNKVAQYNSVMKSLSDAVDWIYNYHCLEIKCEDCLFHKEGEKCFMDIITPIARNVCNEVLTKIHGETPKEYPKD